MLADQSAATAKYLEETLFQAVSHVWVVRL